MGFFLISRPRYITRWQLSQLIGSLAGKFSNGIPILIRDHIIMQGLGDWLFLVFSQILRLRRWWEGSKLLSVLLRWVVTCRAFTMRAHPVPGASLLSWRFNSITQMRSTMTRLVSITERYQSRRSVIVISVWWHVYHSCLLIFFGEITTRQRSLPHWHISAYKRIYPLESTINLLILDDETVFRKRKDSVLDL